VSRRVLFVFLDGVGIGAADPDRNPFLRAELPALRELLGGELPTLERPEAEGSRGVAFPLDARLGVDGLPRSGTGQTALLTGRNAPRIFGGHFGPWTPVRLRPVLESENLLRRAKEAGLSTAFANAYPPTYPEGRSSRTVAPAALAARAAGLMTRHRDALGRGDAVASEIVNTGWRTHLGHRSLPRVTPREAGRNLARIASGARLTFYAHYATDHAGHRGGMEGAAAALERVDAFLSGILEGLPDDGLLLVASDHGNVEDVSAQHTLNPTLAVLAGPDAPRRRQGLETIADLPASILGWLGER